MSRRTWRELGGATVPVAGVIARGLARVDSCAEHTVGNREHAQHLVALVEQLV